jgi:hypothetical protein
MKTGLSTKLESIKWIAQVVGFWTTGGLVLFTLMEVLPNINNGKAETLIPLLPLVFLGVVGYIVSFSRELAGGAMLLAGGLSSVLYILLMVKDPQAALILGLPLVVSGILYLVHWTLLYSKHHKHHRV